MNLLSQVLFRHLDNAERRFEQSHHRPAPPGMATHAIQPARPWPTQFDRFAGHSGGYFALGMVLLVLIFAVDLANGNDISLSGLYLFPVSLVALYCHERWKMTLAAATAVGFQVITRSQARIRLLPYLIEVGVACLTLLLAVVLASRIRRNHLEAVQLATTDGLTNLQNHRAFMAAAEQEFARQRRYGGIVSLAVLDLNDFKRLNDTRGHLAGDDALHLVGEILRSSNRRSDLAARIGGDEFAVLMPNTARHECEMHCVQLGTVLEQRLREAGFGITASIGCRTFDSAPVSVSAALADADAAMYLVKAARPR